MKGEKIMKNEKRIEMKKGLINLFKNYGNNDMQLCEEVNSFIENNFDMEIDYYKEKAIHYSNVIDEQSKRIRKLESKIELYREICEDLYNKNYKEDFNRTPEWQG